MFYLRCSSLTFNRRDKDKHLESSEGQREKERNIFVASLKMDSSESEKGFWFAAIEGKNDL